MKTSNFSAGWLLFLALSPQVWAESPRAEVELPPLFLNQGEQRMLQITGLERYSLGSPAVRVIRLPKELSDSSSVTTRLLIKGVAPGASDLWVWKSDGGTEHRTVKVEKLSPEDLAPALERALGKLRETEIIFSGQGVILRGKVKSIEESARIHGLMEAFPKEVKDESELSDDLMGEGEKIITAWIKKLPPTDKLRLEKIQKSLWVRGSVPNSIESSSLQRQIRSIFPAAFLDLQSLPDNAPTVHFKVFLLELKKSRFGSFGISWPASVEGAFRVTTAAISEAIGLDLAIQALEGEGAAKVLSNPELVVRAPGEAELFSGGELPIHEESHFFSSITWKTFGLTLKLKVTDTTDDQVRLEIFTEVSRLDPSLETDNKIPSIQTNRMKTQVDAKYGSPLLLSGLLQQGTRESARGIPLLRQIPILGALFGSEDYLNEKSELVVILLPSHTPPAAPMERVSAFFPRGPVPAARDAMTPAQERLARNSPEYPWNVLENP